MSGCTKSGNPPSFSVAPVKHRFADDFSSAVPTNPVAATRRAAAVSNVWFLTSQIGSSKVFTTSNFGTIAPEQQRRPSREYQHKSSGLFYSRIVHIMVQRTRISTTVLPDWENTTVSYFSRIFGSSLRAKSHHKQTVPKIVTVEKSQQPGRYTSSPSLHKAI